jgi:hypothetical protein
VDDCQSCCITKILIKTLEGGREETPSELVPKIKIWKFRNPHKFDKSFASGAG